MALGWCIEVAEGLAFLHNNGIVHRDIKPENITMTDTEVFLTEAKIADLKPIRRNFRKNAHLHASPEVLASVMLPDEPEARESSVEELRPSPEAIKAALTHDHSHDEEGQCSLLEYHRTKSESLELLTSLVATASNAEDSIGQSSPKPAFGKMSVASDKPSLLGDSMSSVIEGAVPSFQLIPNVKSTSSLPRVTSHDSMYSPNNSDIGGLKSPGKKLTNSSTASINLGQEKWSKSLAAALPVDDDDDDEEDLEAEDKERTSVIKEMAKFKNRSQSGIQEPHNPDGAQRIFSTPAVLPPSGQKPSALKKEGGPPRRLNLRVRFDTNFGNSEGLAPAEDYSLLYAAPEYTRNM